MLEQILAWGGDVAVLRLGVLVFVFVLMYSLALQMPAFRERKVALLLAAAVSFIAVLGFSDQVVVSIMAGYSGIGTALLFLLPIILLVLVFFWRSDSLGVSFFKLVAAVLVLGFINTVSSSMGSFGQLPRIGDVSVESVIEIIRFVLYIVIFFFGFDVIAKLFFGSGSQEQRS
jgi:hypothetical protein